MGNSLNNNGSNQQNIGNPQVAEPINSTATIKVSLDRLTVYLVISPPVNGGKEITLGAVMDEIETNDIKAKVDKTTIEKAIKDKRYNTDIVIAKGVEAVNGSPGKVSYRYASFRPLSAKINERDEMDYKDLGLIQNIITGTVIAEITPETEGVDGVDVFGNECKAISGTAPKFTVGKGTSLNEDGSLIIAAVDGNLKWQKDHFIIEEVFVLSEDVGVATGNIDFSGDVQIKGGVSEGFTVTSKKNITISGGVNNATIIAGGNVDIKMGCVNSKITAKGSVKIGFCENSKLECKGNLSSSSFVSCDIFCHENMNVTQGKGAIVGGRATCLGEMVFNVIGSESYAKTSITLGDGALLSKEKLELEDEEARLTEEIGSLIQKCNSINAVKKKKGSVPRALEDVLAISIRARFKLSNEIKVVRKRIMEIEASFLNNANLHIEVKKYVWPGVTIHIGAKRKKIETKSDRCRIFIDDTGEIIVKPL